MNTSLQWLLTARSALMLACGGDAPTLAATGHAARRLVIVNLNPVALLGHSPLSFVLEDRGWH
jgi:hypothetical protein